MQKKRQPVLRSPSIDLPMLPRFDDLTAVGIRTRGALHKMQQLHDFPKPRAVPGIGKIFTRSEIFDWFRTRGIDLGLAVADAKPVVSDDITSQECVQPVAVTPSDTTGSMPKPEIRSATAPEKPSRMRRTPKAFIAK